MQRPKEVASELRRISYKHTLWKLMYIIQEMNTCCHHWAAKTLDKHTQPILSTHMETNLI